MKRLHIALAVADLEKSIVEYTKRLGVEPVSVAKGQYALWRTDEVNLSINQNPDEAGQLCHLGFEDSEAQEVSVETDINGFMWERFTATQQREEIFQFYPDADYPEDKAS